MDEELDKVIASAFDVTDRSLDIRIKRFKALENMLLEEYETLEEQLTKVKSAIDTVGQVMFELELTKDNIKQIQKIS